MYASYSKHIMDKDQKVIYKNENLAELWNYKQLKIETVFFFRFLSIRKKNSPKSKNDDNNYNVNA